MVASNEGYQRDAFATVTVLAEGGATLVVGSSPTMYPPTPLQVVPLQEFDLYVLSVGAPGLLAYEFGFNYPPCVLVLQRLLPPGAANFASGNENYIVGTGGTCLSDPVQWLLHVSALVLDTCVGIAQVGPAAPSSFTPPAPGYLGCASDGDLHPYAVGEPLLIQTSTVPGVTLTAQATHQQGAVRVSWDLSGAGHAAIERVRVWRRDAVDAASSLVADLIATQGAFASEWIDASAQPGVTYWYSVGLTVHGAEILSQELAARVPAGALIPTRARLLANAPNPFNPRTAIHFELPRSGDVQLQIVDTAGRRVRTVELRGLSVGAHAWVWQGEDDAGRGVGSGVYTVRLLAGRDQDVRRIALIR